MNVQIQSKIDLLADNYQLAASYTHFEYSLTRILSALLYTNEGRKIEPDQIKAAKQKMKAMTGMFSVFRQQGYVMLATELSMCENMEETFKHTLLVYDMLKKESFHSSEYLAVAAYAIATGKEEYDYLDTVNRMRGFYQKMKENHRFITGADDYIYAAMLAMSELGVETASERMERLYVDLKQSFSTYNGVQSLSHTLTLSEEEDTVLIKRVGDIHKKLKERRYNLDHPYTLSMLGVLAMITDDEERIVEEITEAYEYLKEKKGFGNWSLTKPQRLLLAAAITAVVYVDDMKKETLKNTITSNITNIILAEEAAMIAMISASAAASASAASN